MFSISKYKKLLTVLASMLIIVVSFKLSSSGEATGEVEVALEVDALVTNQIKIHLVGAVLNEGVYDLDEGLRVEDVIELAGGVLPEANTELLNYARVLEDGEKITVLRQKNSVESLSEESVTLTQDKYFTLLEKINYMTAVEFQEVPGIGELISLEIIKLRELKGQFSDVNELNEVSGIGEAKLDKIIKYLQ